MSAADTFDAVLRGDEHPSGPIVELRDVSRLHGEGAREVRALDSVSLTVHSGKSSQSWARQALANQRS